MNGRAGEPVFGDIDSVLADRIIDRTSRNVNPGAGAGNGNPNAAKQHSPKPKLPGKNVALILISILLTVCVLIIMCGRLEMCRTCCGRARSRKRK